MGYSWRDSVRMAQHLTQALSGDVSSMTLTSSWLITLRNQSVVSCARLTARPLICFDLQLLSLVGNTWLQCCLSGPLSRLFLVGQGIFCLLFIIRLVHLYHLKLPRYFSIRSHPSQFFLIRNLCRSRYFNTLRCIHISKASSFDK